MIGIETNSLALLLYLHTYMLLDTYACAFQERNGGVKGSMHLSSYSNIHAVLSRPSGLNS